jgi:hypothetical protein
MYATARLRLVGGSSVARWWLGGGSAAVGSTARRRLQLLRATHHYAAQRQQRRWRRRRRSDGDTKTAISTRTSAMMPREHLPPRDPPTRVMSQCAADAQQPDEQHGVDANGAEILPFLCTTDKSTRSVRHAAQQQTGSGALVRAHRRWALDGRMGFGDAASADAVEPHASQEAARVRTGWHTQHMADTSARLTQSTPTQPLIVPPLFVS